MHPPSPILLIVYNADGGPLNALFDAGHKLISPATYPCSLCALTYGAVSMRGEWKRVIGELPIPVRFHHRDDFAAAHPDAAVPLPAILLFGGDGSLETLISAVEMNALPDLSALIALTRDRLAARGIG